MKKTLVTIVLLLTLACLASCKVNETDKDDATSAAENALWSPDSNTAVVFTENDDINSAGLISSINTLTGRQVAVSYNEASSYEHEIVIGKSNRTMSQKAYDKLESILEGKEDVTGWVIYAKDGDIAIAYDSPMAADVAIDYFVTNYCNESSRVFADGLIASDQFELLEYIRKIREESREEAFKKLEGTLDSGTIDAIKNLYSLYTDDMYVWMANLYDPDIGGFYFSNSGRNNVGFLPDIESTMQILNFLSSSGLLQAYGGSKSMGIPTSIKEQLVTFTKGLQSSEDGFFYHPQWGDSIINARRSRDLNWATQLLETFGEQPLYDTPDGIKGSLGSPGASSASLLTGALASSSSVSAASRVIAAAGSNLPSFLQSMDAWKQYIEDLDLEVDSYTAGNDLAAMHNQISRAGKEYCDYIINYLNEHQDPETGLWEPKQTEYQGGIMNSYNAINGLFKITHFYYYLGASVPNAEAAIQSIIDVVLQDFGDTHVCSVYNPWITFELLLDCIEETDGKQRANEVRKILIDNGEALVTATYNKIIDYKEDDGGFSYRGNTVQLTSQKALVACATSPESDVNATTISSVGIANSIMDTYGVARVPMFTSADYYYFLRVLENLGTIIKDEPQPVTAETFDNYQDSFGEKQYGVVLYPADTVENQVKDVAQSDGKYKYYQSDVVSDPIPSDDMDNALYVKTYATEEEFAANPLYTFVGVSNALLSGNCYKFSGDFLVKNGSSSFMQLLFARDMGAAYDCFGLDFQIYEENGEKFIRIADHKAGPDGDKDNNLADGIPLNSWFNVAVELYKIYEDDAYGIPKLNILAKVFVNGEYVGISSSSRVENGAVVDLRVGAIAFAYSRKINSEIYIDNVKAERTNDVYVAESPLFPVKPEDIPESLPTLEGTHTGGDYYNDTEAAGKRYDYDEGEKAPGTSAKKYAKTYVTPGAYVHYYRLGDENGKHEYITFSYNSVSEESASPHAVLEADVAFGNANANNFLMFKFYSLGMRASLYLNATEDGSKITFRNTVYSTEDAVLLSDTWYNLRIEVYNFEDMIVRFKIYINGEFVAEADGLDVSANDSSKVDIQIQNTDVDSWFAYDNLYLGYIDTEYEELPGVKGPELTGTKDNGAYYNDETKIGKRSDYNSLGAQAPSTSLPDLCEVTEGKYVWFHKGGTSSKSITYSFDTVPDDRAVNIIEFDAAFGNIANEKTFLRILMQSGVCRTDMYLQTDENGLITIANDVIVSGENISVKQGEWHGYRLEYSLNSENSSLVDVKLYVDNVWQCDLQIAGGATGKERVLFYLQGDVDYYMCIDNVYAGYGSQVSE